MLTYQKELFVNIIAELPPLFDQHWRELGSNHDKVPLAPAWQSYMHLEAIGQLQIVTVRDGPKLVGYFFGLVYPALHYETTLYGHSDMFFILKEYMVGLAAGIRLRKLFVKVIDLMRDMGVKRLYINHKAAHDLSQLLERMQFRLVDKVHCMML